VQAKLLIIEGKHAGRPSFAAGLAKKGFAVDTAPNGSAALGCLADVDPDLVVVDAASLRTSGRRICQSLREKLDGLPIVLIVDAKNNPGEDVDANVILTMPFTIQKLINRIKPYLPGEEKNLLHVGPIRLDLEQRRVRCLGQQSRLTPRLVKLLQTLIERHGVVIERTDLFKVVWETDYTQDTRTLDVHISWLREALEVDPRHPRFLKTIRGVGYRLDV
jgi:DNA-binding response OmpR family regulator